MGLGIVGMGSALAQSTDTTGNPMSSLVTKIAQKFNLNEADVQKVFDEEHAAREGQMQQKFEERLSQLVTEGKLTEAQKSAVISKFNEMKAQKDSQKDAMQNMTPEKRRAAMEKKHQELQDWATQNGIDLSLIGPFGKGLGGGFKMRGFGGRGETRNTATPSPTLSQ